MELLAPAGNSQSLKAAVCAGADAVYLGLDKFNARIKADNFTVQDLNAWVKYCHLRGVKVYVVINTLIKEKELSETTEILTVCENSRVDALIIQDLSLIGLAHLHAPSCQLHASTQLGIHNLEGALTAKKLGFTRIVLSRETTLKDIQNIKQNVDIELEYFVHGALCVAFSGNCYLSSTLTGCSGNRGQCLQLCRKKYSNSLNNQSAYWLSTKDQCMLSKSHDLNIFGIDSLKIEGRLRSPEYVFSAVTAYRKSMDCQLLTENDIYRLQTTFNRGNYTNGYAFNDDIIYPYIQNNMGYRIGTIIKREKCGNKYLLTLNNSIPLSDTMSCKIIDNGTEVDGFAVKSIGKNQLLADRPYCGEVHITADKSIADCIHDNKIGCRLVLEGCIGEQIKLSAIVGNLEEVAISDYIIERAKQDGIGNDKIKDNLSKLGNSDFFAEDIEINISADSYIPLSIVNNLRRLVIEKLNVKLLQEYELKRNIESSNSAAIDKDIQFKSKKIEKIIIICDSNVFSKIEYKWLNRVEIVTNIHNYSNIRHKTSNNKTIYIKLPIFAPYENLCVIKDFLAKNAENNIGIYVENLYALELANEFNLPIIVGTAMNIFNAKALNAIGNVPCCVSSELREEEFFSKDLFIYSYGYLPLMTLAHCPIKTITKSKCDKCKYESFEIVDERSRFYIKRERFAECVFTLYNGIPHNLTDIDNNCLLDFTVGEIDPNEVINCAYNSTKIHLPNSTRGSVKRGVK